MRRDDAIDTLKVITATWPRPVIDEAQAEIWIGFLRDVKLEHATAAIRQLVAEGTEHQPNVSVFFKRCKQIRRLVDSRGALPDGVERLPAKTNLEHLREARKALPPPRPKLREPVE